MNNWTDNLIAGFVVVGLTLILAVSVLAVYYIGPWGCQARGESMRLPYRWSLALLCQVETPDGRWIGPDQYRYVETH